MRRLLRSIVIVFVAGVLAFGMTGAAMAAVVVQSGFVTVSVQERSADGAHIYLPVPVKLVELGVNILPLVMPERELARMRQELAPHRAGLRGLAQALGNMPDATLVEVRGAREQVTVKKLDGSLQIEVHSSDADVEVSVPAASLVRILDSLT